MISNKQVRIEIFEGTRSLYQSNERLKSSVEKSCREQTIYWEGEKIDLGNPCFSSPLKLVLSKEKTVEAARKYAKAGKKVCILNFASSVAPGGGVVNGSQAQEESFARGVCSHWCPISKEGCRALADNGIKLINCTGGEVREYDGDPSCLPYGHAARLLHNRQPETKLFTRIGLNSAIANSICAYNHLTTKQIEETNENCCTVYDEQTGVHFKRLLTHGVMINLSKLEEMEEEYQKMLSCAFASFGGHEQYFYPDYFAYQNDHGEKLLKACRIMNENGFRFIFAEDLV